MVPKHRIMDKHPNGGDGFEQRFWHVVGDRFPNYEVFWSEVIWDLTMRRSGNLHMPTDLPSHLILLGMCHYTIFRSLVYIGIIKDAPGTEQSDVDYVNENEKMKNIYAHFGVVEDMTHRIISVLCLIESEMRGERVGEITFEVASEKFGKWFKSSYTGQFNRYKKFFRPVSFPLHGRGDGIEALEPGPIVNDFRNLFEARLRRYRNLLHNPDAGRVYVSGKAWVPRPEYLEEFALWPDMWSRFSSERDKFESLPEAINTDFGNVLTCLNKLWGLLIPRFTALFGEEKFKTWKAGATRKPTAESSAIPFSAFTSAATQGAMFIGTASASAQISEEALKELFKRVPK